MHPKFFVTTNKNKLREVNEILGEELESIEIELIEPQALEVEEVVKEKAMDAFMKIGKPVLVEDTGLYFETWNGLPGALIKWFLLSVGNQGILRMMTGEPNRKVIAKTAIGFYDGKEAHVFIGEVAGIIAGKIMGESNFGWDPIFIPAGYKKSFAQMNAEEKNKISMRYIALMKLKSTI